MLETKKFQKSMESKGLWNVVKPFVEQSSADVFGKENMTVFIELLDKNLPLEDRLSVMEELGCCKSPANQAPFKAFFKKYADKPLKDRVRLMATIDSPHNSLSNSPTLNDDNTLSVSWAYGQENNYACVCTCKTIIEVRSSGNSTVSPTFCACCAGNIKSLYQAALGVKLKLKNVVSSVISTGGQKHCEFIFDIIEK